MGGVVTAVFRGVVGRSGQNGVSGGEGGHPFLVKT